MANQTKDAETEHASRTNWLGIVSILVSGTGTLLGFLAFLSWPSAQTAKDWGFSLPLARGCVGGPIVVISVIAGIVLWRRSRRSPRGATARVPDDEGGAGLPDAVNADEVREQLRTAYVWLLERLAELLERLFEAELSPSARHELAGLVGLLTRDSEHRSRKIEWMTNGPIIELRRPGRWFVEISLEIAEIEKLLAGKKYCPGNAINLALARAWRVHHQAGSMCAQIGGESGGGC